MRVKGGKYKAEDVTVVDIGGNYDGVDVEAVLAEVASSLAGQNEFTELLDTPASYSGQSLKGVRINSGETALEFRDFDSDYIKLDGTTITSALIPFAEGLSVPTDKEIQFRSSAVKIFSSSGGMLDIVARSTMITALVEFQVDGGLIDINAGDGFDVTINAGAVKGGIYGDVLIVGGAGSASGIAGDVVISGGTENGGGGTGGFVTLVGGIGGGTNSYVRIGTSTTSLGLSGTGALLVSGDMEVDGATVLEGNLTTLGTITSGNITISSPTPILVFKDSNSLGAASVGFIEWRDSGGGRAGFFGNSSSGNDDLVWKNEVGGHITIQTTGAGEFKVFATLNLAAAENMTFGSTGTSDIGDTTNGIQRLFIANDKTSSFALPDFRGFTFKDANGDTYFGNDNVFPGFYVQKTVTSGSTASDNSDDITNLYQGDASSPKLEMMFDIPWNTELAAPNGVTIGAGLTDFDTTPLIFGNNKAWIRYDETNSRFKIGLGAGGTSQYMHLLTGFLEIKLNSKAVQVAFRPETDDKIDISDIANNLRFKSLYLAGGFSANIVTKTADYIATADDHVILMITGATTRTVSFPAASTLTGKIFHIKKIDSGAGLVILDPDSTETIDGDQTPDITAQYESFMIVSDGSNWHVI